MATTIPCNIDTTPMANELGSVSNHVMGTTAAVVTMQGAVISAENNSANKVCSNVNRGFFTMIRSQISQKIASKHSKVEALIMHLAQQKRQLVGIKSNMEREYGRITERYLKIFTSINKELESRIRQLDQPVFEIVCKHMLTSSNRMNALTSWASTSQSEGLTQAQQIVVSRMKDNAQTALEQSKDFLVSLNEQRAIAQRVLISGHGGGQDAYMQIPVVVLETINNPAGITACDVKVNEHMAAASASDIQTAILADSQLPWTQQQLPSMVTDEFNRMLEDSDKRGRIKQLMQQMFASAQVETI